MSESEESTPHVGVEKEKTKRTLIVTSAITVIGLTATILFFQNIGDRGGTLKVSDKGVEVNLQQPITSQVGTSADSVTVFGAEVRLTTGTVSDSVVKSLESLQGAEKGAFSGNKFAGSNLIDTAAGFVIASDRPRAWKVQTSADGLSRSLRDASGSAIVLSSRVAIGVTDVRRDLTQLVDSLRSAGIRAKTTLDASASSAMIWYTATDSSQVCIKLVAANNKVYRAMATTKDESAVRSITASVAAFTPIASK